MPSFRRLILAAALLGLATVTAQARTRPLVSCGAIAFRPLPATGADGDQDAGFYATRFGRVAVQRQMKAGRNQGYVVELDGHRLAAVPPGGLPAAVADCTRAKRLAAPAAAAPHCTGDRLTLVLFHEGDRRYLLLYGHSRGAWRFCSAGAVRG